MNCPEEILKENQFIHSLDYFPTSVNQIPYDHHNLFLEAGFPIKCDRYLYYNSHMVRVSQLYRKILCMTVCTTQTIPSRMLFKRQKYGYKKHCYAPSELYWPSYYEPVSSLFSTIWIRSYYKHSSQRLLKPLSLK